MKLFSKKDIGTVGERAAARFLRREGYRIIAKNRHCGRNELDLIAADRQYLAFVEVKTLSFDDPSDVNTRPALKVDAAKRHRTVEAAKVYLKENPTPKCPRLDVIEVYLDRKSMKPFKIHHIPDAFSAKGEIK